MFYITGIRAVDPDLDPDLDPQKINADPDPDPAFLLNADPDTAA